MQTGKSGEHSLIKALSGMKTPVWVQTDDALLTDTHSIGNTLTASSTHSPDPVGFQHSISGSPLSSLAHLKAAHSKSQEKINFHS